MKANHEGKKMTKQELDLFLRKAQYQRQVLQCMFPQMFGCDGRGDDRYLQENEEERYSQEGN